MKTIFKIEGVNSKSDTIIWDNAKTEKTAKAKALKMFKNQDVYSIWIHKFIDYGDPVYQWSKYRDDLEWRGGNFW